MCGIVGYIGKSDAAPILFSSLKRLEYRGYDSVGLAVINNHKICIKKDKGRIDDVDSKLDLKDLPGNVGIGHTRWSTHGVPNKINAHPHLDCKKCIAIAHNGIIENYSVLKKMLIKEGHKIVSDTDSEIIAHLIEKFYDGNLEDAVRNALLYVEGAYGLVVIHKDESKIVAARNGSPLIIGIGNGEMFVASDASAILKHTRKVIYLNDKEICVLTRNKVSVKDLENKKVKKCMEKITWNLKQIEKCGFKHFMLKEIMEQPESIKNCMLGRIKIYVKLSVNVDPRKINRIVITACGTSWHAALIGKYMIEKFAEIPAEVDYASEFRYRNPMLDERSLVIVISQSGETADTLAALREARKKNAKSIGIVNVVGSTIAREVDSGIYLHAGPEIGVASTKAFTSQIVALILLSLYLRKLKNLPIDKMFVKELSELPEKMRVVLEKRDDVKKIAEKFVKSKNFLYLGRGINFPVALEGALKLKEISYIHAEGYPAAEMKHGPIALIDKNMPVVFIANKNHGYEKIINNMEEVKARKGVIIAIATEGDRNIKRLADYVIYVPKTLDELTPIINVIPLQLLAYYIADLKGLDVDKPRHLAKSVTVE